MNLEINTELIKHTQSLKISLEEWVILSLMKNEEYEILNIWDKNSTDTKLIILYQKLCREDWIKTTSGEENNLFELTEKAKQLIGNETKN